MFFWRIPFSCWRFAWFFILGSVSKCAYILVYDYLIAFDEYAFFIWGSSISLSRNVIREFCEVWCCLWSGVLFPIFDWDLNNWSKFLLKVWFCILWSCKLHHVVCALLHLWRQYLMDCLMGHLLLRILIHICSMCLYFGSLRLILFYKTHEQKE